jgi:hypothetical protein
MLCVGCNLEHYAECRYTECRYTECHGVGDISVKNEMEQIIQLKIFILKTGAYPVKLLHNNVVS